MAKTDLEVNVSLEKVIHASLQKVLQQIWDDHNICVNEISANWVYVSTNENPSMLLTDLTVRTSTKV